MSNAIAAIRPTPIIPTDYESAWRMAVAISKSGLAPKNITSPEGIFTAMQLGAEVGLTPMSALQNIAVVNGRPTIWGDAQLALVRASGLLTSFEETYEGKEGEDNYKAVCKAGREGYGNLCVNEFSIADAKAAGLWNKEGPWRTNFKRMLKMRARAFTLRDQFTDILKGIYSTEEARDIPASAVIDGSFASVDNLNSEFNSQPTIAAPAKADAKPAKGKKAEKAEQKVDATAHDAETGEVLTAEQVELNRKKKAQQEVEELYKVLQDMPEPLRASGFLDVDGLAMLDAAGRNDVVDKLFTEIGIKLPPRE